MKICRACLSTEIELIRLDEHFINKYNLLTNLNIELSDDVPQYSCGNCYSTVDYFISFRDKCVSSEVTLQKIIEKEVKHERKPYECPNNENIVNNESKTISSDDNIKDEVKTEYLDDCNLDFLNEHFVDFDSVQIKFEVVDDAKPKKVRKKKAKVEPNGRLRTKTGNVYENPLLLCGICTKSFDDKKSLMKHLEDHKKDRQCELCYDIFATGPQLLAHRFEHIPFKQKKCHLCHSKFQSSVYFEYHYMMSHCNGVFTDIACRHCGLKYKTPRGLKKHIWSSHSNNKFICDICSKEFNNKQRLKTHIVSHNSLKTCICDLCGYSTKFNSNLRTHIMRKHHPSRCFCKNCNKAFIEQRKLDEHERKCVDLAGICNVCGKNFKNKKSMKVHMRSHSDEKRYKCAECGAAYKTSGGLRAHRDRHRGERTKRCPHCPARFYSASVLVKHRRVHTGEKPYVCKVCHKGFTGNNNLKVHMKVHGESWVVKKKDQDEKKLLDIFN